MFIFTIFAIVEVQPCYIKFAPIHHEPGLFFLIQFSNWIIQSTDKE